ncbi:MAG: class II aldolase/adducin family protein [Candidatus Omnitrophica bacterium]|nr:class II aldolase/adducin family protein [Candidatus Omnitrophota bacterium]
MNKLKKEIIEIGKLLWDKDLASGLNGNISVRVDEKSFLLTGRGTCLGRLTEDDIVQVDLDGNVIGKGEASSENLMHREIYKTFSETKAIVHTHLTYASGYFSVNDTLTPITFESRLYLGKIQAVSQTTPTVTDVAPVIEALKSNNIMMLKSHGSLAIGKNLFDCFLLTQCLEESVKMDAVSRIYKSDTGHTSQVTSENKDEKKMKKFKLFSREQIDEIVRLVNLDKKLAELGKSSQMTMDLAVKLDENGVSYRFKFEDGKIVDVAETDQAEFVVSAPEEIWRSVFAREIDPFVATTQKRMNLKGDFAKISKWYAPCSRLFELWQEVGVE